MGPVARALECAHKFPDPSGTHLSILHRDLKPENLFLAKQHGQETLKILDFGIGKVRSAATQMVGRVSAEQGNSISAFTPAYGSPEQWLPKRYGQTGPWTDVWGFTLCMVEALTNRAPFEGDAPAVMVACINEQDRPTPLSFGVRLPARAEAAFRKALEVDPVNRFHDIGAFWDEVEGAVGVITPRIAAAKPSLHDSVPPTDVSPFAQTAQTGQQSSLLTELDATKRVPGAEPFPDLTLGLPTHKPVKAAPAAKPIVSSKSQNAGPGVRNLEEDTDGTPLHLSLMESEAPPPKAPVATAASPRTGPRSGPGAAAIAAPPVSAPRVAAVASVSRSRGRLRPSERPTVDTVLSRLMPALRLIAIGVAIMIADVVYATVNGDAFRVGPLRALYVAGPLVGYGVVKLVLSLAG
jgi:serine/threonine-protein kinase